MPEDVPPLVTLHLWRVPRRRIPGALRRMAVHHQRLGSVPGLRFGKLLGTGDGRTFTVRDATPRRWGLIACWSTVAEARAFERSPIAVSWADIADEQFRIDLRALSARGRWSRREPFGNPRPHRHDGPVAAVTRARIAAARAATFWRAVPPVSADLHRVDGVRLAVGIGESPIGLQGTFSVWDSAEALRDFAHRRPAHLEAVRRTAEERWYAEELFARFAVLGTVGTVDGRDPMAERAMMGRRPCSA